MANVEFSARNVHTCSRFPAPLTLIQKNAGAVYVHRLGKNDAAVCLLVSVFVGVCVRMCACVRVCMCGYVRCGGEKGWGC